MAADKINRPPDDGVAKPSTARRAPAADAHVSRALRSAYEETVREDIPAEFLDLLGKLS